LKENTESYKLLEDSEEMYKNIIYHLMDIIIVLDLKGNLIKGNRN
jgi:hypothetical protein